MACHTNTFDVMVLLRGTGQVKLQLGLIIVVVVVLGGDGRNCNSTHLSLLIVLLVLFGRLSTDCFQRTNRRLSAVSSE